MAKQNNGTRKKIRPKPDMDRPDPNRPLRSFGNYLEELRRAKGLSQADFATNVDGRLNRLGLSATQTLIARIGAGTQEPRLEVIEAIAHELNKSPLELIARITQEKYQIPPEKVSCLLRNPLTMTELAQWERDQGEVWIVTTVYLDPINKIFEQAVQHILAANGTVTFFIPNSEIEEFDLWRNTLFPDWNSTPKLLRAPIPLEAAATLAASFVIANPSHIGDKSKSPPTGYVMLNSAEAVPELALQMYPQELRRRIVLFRGLIQTGKLTPK